MRAELVRVTPPSTVHHLTMDELRQVMSHDNEEFPTSITVTCDGCEGSIRVEVVVNATTTAHARLAMARVYATTKGWSTDENGDLCPKHPEGTP